MNKNYKMLGLDKVLCMLEQKVECEDSKFMAKNLKPTNDWETVNLRLRETDDAYKILAKYSTPSFSGLRNIVNYLKRAENGGSLSTSELLRVAEILHILNSLKEFNNKYDINGTTLYNRFYNIYSNYGLEKKIKNSILSEDEISDFASTELADIRRKINSVSNRIREQLDKIIHSSTMQKYLQEPIVTIRSGRFVVPVKAENRKNISGLVHDTSSSGSTVFIEPISVVELNNEIRVLRSKEKTEIDRILKELSSAVGNVSEQIISSYKIAVELDVIFAKADLAYQMNACMPKINSDGKINLKNARHPLIEKNKVIPTNISLGINFDTLIITGPNTGGKTVALKTIGLFVLMTMCGLMIPVNEESEISVFSKVLADIGDEQSIEQSLSTFSAHMVNIIDILKQADNQSLILLDELGAGTDPVEGAALATSILEELRILGAKTVATTHYAELKAYAISNGDIENACCEFDISTLQPTYRFLIGIPGKSNAFAIAEKLGINSKIIDNAKALVSEQDTKFEDVVASLNTAKQKLETERLQIETLKKKLNEENKKIAEIKKSTEQKCKFEIDAAKEKAIKIVDSTKHQANFILDEIEKLKKSAKTSSRSVDKLRRDMDDLEKTADPVEKRKNNDYVLPRKLKVGDMVLIFDIDKKGTVIDVNENSGTATIQAGIVKTRVPITNIRLLNEKPVQVMSSSNRRNVVSRASAPVVRELDLRGQTAIEATFELDNFIDAAILAGVNKLTIIHGKGTGVLRREIQKHLKGHPAVKSYRLGVFGEGESGVTIVELK